MTIIPSIVSGLFSILLWFYVRRSIKRNIVDLFKASTNWLFLFDFLFVFCAFFRFIYRLQNSYVNNTIFYFLMNLSYILLGLLGLVVLICIMMDLKILSNKWGPQKTSPATDLSRREFLKKNFTVTGIASATVMTGVGFNNSFNPKIVKVNIPLPPEHKKLHGLKIVQLSDIHIGPTLKKDFCEKIVTETNDLNPDIVVITGDSIDGEVKFLKEDVAPLLNIKARLGIYYVLGNHEYYWYANEWIEWARSSGLNPLINENVRLNFNDTDFYIAGVNDPAAKKIDPTNASDPKKAALGIPKEAYKILLAHQPKSCFQACKEGFHTQLSGHTHGGQGFPWNIIVHLVQPYVKGLHNHEGMNVYVHSGTGFWGPPNRFMVNSEIAEIIFTSSENV